MDKNEMTPTGSVVSIAHARDGGIADRPPRRSILPANRAGLGNPWLTLVAAVFGLLMIGLDSTIVSVANPTIGRHFHATLSDLQWVTNAYLLALAVTLVFGGKLGDLLGRKRIFLIGTAGFALASLACGLSTSLGELIAFRATQGVFGAIMVPQTLATLRVTFPIEKLAMAIGLWTMSSSIGIASGPIARGRLDRPLAPGSSHTVQLDLALPRADRTRVRPHPDRFLARDRRRRTPALRRDRRRPAKHRGAGGRDARPVDPGLGDAAQRGRMAASARGRDQRRSAWRTCR
jgi:hypothetical protein